MTRSVEDSAPRIRLDVCRAVRINAAHWWAEAFSRPIYLPPHF